MPITDPTALLTILPTTDNENTQNGQAVHFKEILVNSTQQFGPIQLMTIPEKPVSLTSPNPEKPAVPVAPHGTAELVSVALDQCYVPERTAYPEMSHRLSFTFIFPDKRRYCMTRTGKVRENGIIWPEILTKKKEKFLRINVWDLPYRKKTIGKYRGIPWERRFVADFLGETNQAFFNNHSQKSTN